jgi:hypothetical protein
VRLPFFRSPVSSTTGTAQVARKPSVFVRALSMDEGQKLQRITRTAKNPIRLRRAIVVLTSGQDQSVRNITSLLQVSEDYVRDVIHAFNERGFDALDPNRAGDARSGSVRVQRSRGTYMTL